MHARFSLNLRHRLTVAATCALVAGAPGLAQAGESAPSAASLSEEALQLQAPSSETSLLPEQRSAFSGVLLPPPAPRLYAITPERRALLNTCPLYPTDAAAHLTADHSSVLADD